MDIVWIAALGLLWLAVAQLGVGLDRMGQPHGEKTGWLWKLCMAWGACSRSS
mgnify:CR=1 FL=1